MKFRTRLMLAMVALLAVFLTLNSGFTLWHTFHDTLTALTAQCEAQLQSDRERVEQAVAADHSGDTMPYQLQKAAAALPQQSGRWTAVYWDGLSAWANLPAGLYAVAPGAEAPSLHRSGERTYLLLGTPLVTRQGKARLVQVFDLTPQFSARNRQLLRAIAFNLATLAAAALAAWGLAAMLTRPLQTLRRTTERIAQGEYALRTGLDREDELGSLSRSFDHMAEAVEQRVKQLEEHLRQREDFVAAFTHELKTPMTSMLGYAAVLRSQPALSPAQQRAAGHIYRETGRLEALSLKLLALMGLKDGVVELCPVEVPPLFEELNRSLPAQYETPAGAVVVADAVLLDDLLRNLVQNALHAVAENGGHVAVYGKPGADGFLFAVEDNGPGIPPEELRRITEPFYMVDKSRARKNNGTGLGLAIASRIAELHGTQLHFESSPGNGTTVTFTLPTPEEMP